MAAWLGGGPNPIHAPTPRKPGAPVIIAANGKSRVPDGIVLANGEGTTAADVRIDAVAAYDIKPGDPYHPKGEANGYVLTANAFISPASPSVFRRFAR